MNTNDLIVPYELEDKERSVDLTDLLAAILLRWKTVIACFLIFVILGVGISFVFATSSVPLSEQITSARDELTEEEIADVENLRARYLAYQDYQRTLQDDFAHYLSNASRASEYVLMRCTYFVHTSMENLDVILPYFVLDENDHDLIREVITEEDDFTNIYRRVTVNCGRGAVGPHDGGTYVYIMPEGATPPQLNYYIWITLYGSSEEECDAMMDIVDAALRAKLGDLRELDPDMTLEPVQREYSRNALEYINGQVNVTQNILNDVENQMANVVSARINRLPAKERTYYNLLAEEPTEEAEEVVKTISWKKWSLVGALFGLFVGCGFCMLQYFFDGKVKTSDEVEKLFRTHTLQHMYLEGKKNLFGKPAKWLIEADDTPLELKSKLCATDLYLHLEKYEYKRLFIACDLLDEKALQIAHYLKEFLSEKDSGLDIYIGNPMSSTEELERISCAEVIVVMAELKHSRVNTFSQWAAICKRLKLNTIGCVAVEVCW